ncbi:hypothetical protein SELMODRAFT_83642, partial [Selaginella moellendorffii]
DEMEFTQAESNVDNLVFKYQQYQDPKANDEGRDTFKISCFLSFSAFESLVCKDVISIHGIAALA